MHSAHSAADTVCLTTTHALLQLTISHSSSLHPHCLFSSPLFPPSLLAHCSRQAGLLFTSFTPSSYLLKHHASPAVLLFLVCLFFPLLKLHLLTTIYPWENRRTDRHAWHHRKEEEEKAVKEEEKAAIRKRHICSCHTWQQPAKTLLQRISLADSRPYSSLTSEGSCSTRLL